MNHPRIDPVLWMLLGGLAVFTGVLLYVEHQFKDDAVLFQVISGLITSFSGAFFMRVKPQQPPQPGEQIPNPTKSVTEVKTTVSAPEPPKDAEAMKGDA